MKKLFEKIKKALQKAITPNFRCMGCGADEFDQSGFCAQCLPKVPFNNGKTCRRCGVALHGAEDFCGHCAFEKTYYDKGYSPFCYEGLVQKAILDMKFHNNAVNAQVLARYLAQCATQHNLQFDCVTFVPMTPSAQKKRGYNQAQLLAESFCDILNLPAPLPLLKKVKETQPQEKLGKKQRLENLVGAFAATQPLKGKTVLLIDDIKTTGATLNQCAMALKRRSAEKVLFLTVASREEHTVWELESEM